MSDAIHELLTRLNTMIAREEAACQEKRARAGGDREALISAAEDFRCRVAPIQAERDRIIKMLADLKAFEPAVTIIVPR